MANKVKKIMIIKSQIILYIYDELINGRDIKMNEILALYNISVRTFRRYISEINIYLCDNYKNQIVVYNHSTNSYFIKKVTIEIR